MISVTVSAEFKVFEERFLLMLACVNKIYATVDLISYNIVYQIIKPIKLTIDDVTI